MSPHKGCNGTFSEDTPWINCPNTGFVSAGTHEPVEIQRLLKHHVHYYMCAGNLPNPTDRAYYPLLDDIKNHVSRSKRAMQLSVLDQENAQKKIEQWKELSPTSRYHFRPYRKNNEEATECESKGDFEETILWVHQESWQQQLMIMYGNTISLMDATYKTTKYDLPLFFISVRTNSGYCVVAEFIVQSESATHIAEALQTLKSWNPDWHPTFFMTDHSDAEIAALESSFPATTVYLCDFHREQAWERWVCEKKHALSTSDADSLLDHLRACAWAPSADPDEGLPYDHHLQEAVAELQRSHLWKTNEYVQQWLNNTWLNMSEVCKKKLVHMHSSYRGLDWGKYRFPGFPPGQVVNFVCLFITRPQRKAWERA